ncbi:hypothetical protein GCM10010468_35530 [Actinocorallia longicatena]|uniref:Uncharacterized protein n=1 Tax=Actinocorallia longicatena TaxID=111803 RepID=A0ABP6QA89_9ACTN
MWWRRGSGNSDPSIALRVYAHVIRTAEAAAADVFAEALKPFCQQSR